MEKIYEMELNGIKTISLVLDESNSNKAMKYSKKTRKNMEYIQNKLINELRMHIKGKYAIKMDYYTKNCRKIDGINVVHLILNAGNKTVWDDSQFWDINIRRHLITDGQREYRKITIYKIAD